MAKGRRKKYNATMLLPTACLIQATYCAVNLSRRSSVRLQFTLRGAHCDEPSAAYINPDTSSSIRM